MVYLYLHFFPCCQSLNARNANIIHHILTHSSAPYFIYDNRQQNESYRLSCLDKDLQRPSQYWSLKHKLNCSATIIAQKHTDVNTAQEILG
jgi:hypothetical protein